jgi:hypothetical protein
MNTAVTYMKAATELALVTLGGETQIGSYLLGDIASHYSSKLVHFEAQKIFSMFKKALA